MLPSGHKSIYFHLYSPSVCNTSCRIKKGESYKEIEKYNQSTTQEINYRIKPRAFKITMINRSKNYCECVHYERIDGEFQQRTESYTIKPNGNVKNEKYNIIHEEFFQYVYQKPGTSQKRKSVNLHFVNGIIKAEIQREKKNRNKIIKYTISVENIKETTTCIIGTKNRRD